MCVCVCVWVGVYFFLRFFVFDLVAGVFSAGERVFPVCGDDKGDKSTSVVKIVRGDGDREGHWAAALIRGGGRIALFFFFFSSFSSREGKNGCMRQVKPKAHEPALPCPRKTGPTTCPQRVFYVPVSSQHSFHTPV